MKERKKIVIRIDGKDWQEALDQALETENAKVKVDGFRKGKAPKEVYLKRYGVGSLLMPAAELKFSDAYVKMLEENKDLEIVARPKGDIIKLEESGVEFQFELVLRPEVKLEKYKNLGVEKEEVKTSDAEVEAELEKMLEHYAELKIKKGKAKIGDIVVIDFDGTKDGKPFEGGNGKGYSLQLGSNTFIPGFEEQLEGLKAGETKTFNLSFPKEYPNKDLASQEVTFKVDVKEVKEKNKRKLNEEFFKDLNFEGISDKETLLKVLEENLKTSKEQALENEYLTKIFDVAISNMKVEVPDEMIDEEIDRIIENYQQQLKMQGIELEKYYEMTKTSEEDLRKMVRAEALKRVQTRFVLEEVIKKEKIEASDKEVNDLVEDMANKHQKDKKEIEELYGGIEPLRYEIKMRKAIDILKG